MRPRLSAIVKQWGNSAAVDQRVEDGRINEPIADNPFDLAVLLAGITDENRHESTETGGAMGGEAW